MVDKSLFIFTSILITISIISAYSLPIFYTFSNNINPYKFAIVQSVAGFGGIYIMYLLASLDANKWLKPIGFGLFITFGLTIVAMMILPDTIVPTINGAKRWIKLGAISISPIEFFKIGFIFFLAWSLSRKHNRNEKKDTFQEQVKFFLPYMVLFIFVALSTLFFQNDFGQTVLLAIILISMFIFAGLGLQLFLTLIAIAAGGAGLYILMTPHALTRIKDYWFGIQDIVLSIFPDWISAYLKIKGSIIEKSTQVSDSISAIHNGGIFGQGIGSGVAKLGHLSDVHTDFVLAGITEESGLIGFLVILVFMIALIFRIFRVANRSVNHMQHFFCVGFGIMIAAQFSINTLGITGVIPLKGIAVPFLSYGGSSMLALCIGIGLTLMISKKAQL